MKVSSRALIAFLIGLCLAASGVFAEVVTEVGRDGTLTLESGKQIVLAGVELDSDGISVLRVLAQKQDVRIQLLRAAPGIKEAAYVYLQAKYLRLPMKPQEVSEEQEILINEFLVHTGAAKVAESQDFSRKAEFLKVQAEAKRKGEGIWSYEVL